MMADVLEFNDVCQEVRGSMNNGRLKLQSTGFIFKNSKTGIMEQFAASDVDKAMWLIRARGHCLKMILKSGTTQRFDGFKDTDYEALSSFVLKHFSTKLEKKDLSVKGWNWGTANFVGNTLEFKVDGVTSFEVPLGNIFHSTSQKNEVTLEFHQNDDAAVSLTEMRFHIPSDSTADTDPVNEFYKNVVAKADIIQATGDAITTFTDVPCLTPRGRYDIKIYPSFLQLHGKTFDYKIPYTTILRLFLLPHRDNRQMFFVLSLDPPIKQGQTRYHFLILLFNKDTETTLEIALSEEDLEKKYDGKLSKEMSGEEYEVISRIMKVLVNKKITVPGSFLGHTGTQSIHCSYKAATGFLYPLERGFIFVHKPPVHIRFDEVASVNFARSTGNMKSFDFDIETKVGTVFTFVGIEKDEYGKLYDFVMLKKLRVKNIGGNMYAKASMEDDMAESEEEDHDMYLERMKAEGKQRVDQDYEDDEDESSDEDFQPEGSASEPDDEYDSNISSSTSESEDDYSQSKSGSDAGSDSKEPSRKKEKKSKPKKERKERKERGEKTHKKRVKKGRAPDQPKRPSSAFFQWLGENRAKIKEDNPGISVTDITKKAGEMWKEITDKSRWEAMAAKEKEEYEVAMAEWKDKHKDDSPPDSPSPTSKKSKAVKRSPTKESTSGAGSSYKSKEFIESEGESSADSEEEEEEPVTKRKTRADGGDAEEDPLPDDEDILSEPTASEPEDAASGSDMASD